MKRLPGLLLTVCIIAIALGALGVFGGLFGAVGAMVGPAMQKAMTSAQPVGADDPQMQMQKEINEITNRWAVLNYLLLGVQLMVGTCLVIAGILTLQRKPVGRTLLFAALLAAVGFELIRLVPTISTQLAMADLMERHMTRSMKAGPSGGPPPPPGTQSAMQMGMKAGLIFGLLLGGLWLLLKLGYYGFSVYYLRRPDVKALFEPAAEPEFSDDMPAEAPG